MPAPKDIMKMSDDQVIDLVTAQFKDSADDRREKNWQNYLYDKTFRGVDLDKPLSPSLGDNNLGLGLELLGGREGEESLVRSQIYLPYARSIILTAKNMLAQAIFPNNTDFFQVYPQDRNEIRGAEAFKSFAHYDMRRGNYQDEAELAIERALVHDFQLFMVDWETDYMWAPVISNRMNRAVRPDGTTVAIGSAIGKKIEYQWVAGTRSGTSFAAPSTYNVRHDIMAIHGPISPATCEWVGLEYKMSWRRLMDMAKAGELKISKVREAEKEGGDSETIEVDFDAMVREDLKLQAERKGKAYDPTRPGSDDDSHALVWDRWDWTSRLTIINKKWVVRKQRSVGIPFVKLVCYPVHGQFGGIPMIADLVHIQIDINTMLRLRRDAQNNAVNKTMIVDESAFRSSEDIDKIRLNPLESIRVTPAPGRTVNDAVGWVQPPNPGFETINEQNNELQFAERISRISDTATGLVSNTGRRTATEHELAAQGTARATGFNARTLERAIVSGVVQLMLVQYNLRLTDEMKFRVVGPKGMEWRRVHPSDFYFGMLPEIVPTGLSGEQARALELDLFLRGVKMCSEVPPWAQMTDWPALLREMWVKLRVPDVDRMIRGDGLYGADLPQEMENILMRSGHYVAPLPTQPHETHIEVLRRFATSGEFRALPEQAQALFARHAKEHELLMQQAMAPQLAVPGMPGTGGQPGKEATPASMSEMGAQLNRAVAARNSGG
jgi:hypothetical protein